MKLHLVRVAFQVFSQYLNLTPLTLAPDEQTLNRLSNVSAVFAISMEGSDPTHRLWVIEVDRNSSSRGCSSVELFSRRKRILLPRKEDDCFSFSRGIKSSSCRRKGSSYSSRRKCTCLQKKFPLRAEEKDLLVVLEEDLLPPPEEDVLALEEEEEDLLLGKENPRLLEEEDRLVLEEDPLPPEEDVLVLQKEDFFF